MWGILSFNVIMHLRLWEETMFFGGKFAEIWQIFLACHELLYAIYLPAKLSGMLQSGSIRERIIS